MIRNRRLWGAVKGLCHEQRKLIDLIGFYNERNFASLLAEESRK